MVKGGSALRWTCASLGSRPRSICPQQLRKLQVARPRCPAPVPAANRAFHCSSKRLREPVHEAHPEFTRSAPHALDGVAFAFDIDGVLTQGKKAVAGAREVLRALRARGIPYLLLTNGGGSHEDDKIKSLGKTLEVSDAEDLLQHRVILSHTPMRGWGEDVKRHGTVLITGSHPEMARRVAREYGFAKVVTPADLLAANELVYPFAHLRDSLHSDSEELPDGKKLLNLDNPYRKDIPSDCLKIDKILVWNDPRDWSLDIQIIHDALISRQGYMGTISEKNGDTSLPNHGWQQDGQPDLWISNLDLYWKTNYAVNRFGTGSFMEALKGVWSAVTGGTELQYNALGKPSDLTYRYAHDRLLHYHSDLTTSQSPTSSTLRSPQKLRRVYMIGDNPESDIRGANEFTPDDRSGTEWLSVLLDTGVWRETSAQRTPKYAPTLRAVDVVDGVAAALRNEGVDVGREELLAAKPTML